MTDINRLKVSLTKHGAHKVAELIKYFPTDEVLANTWDRYNNIKIDRAQSSKNLSANNNGTLPTIWHEVKLLGDEHIEDLVLLAIIFSHHDLINIMINGSIGRMKGTVRRGDFDNEKSYTNFANNIEELGFNTAHTYDKVSYDLSRIFEKNELVPLVIQLLTLKLRDANWNAANDFLDECIGLNFHRVFGIDEAEFREWLEGGRIEKSPEKEEIIEEEPNVGDVDFKGGHVEKSEADVVVRRAKPKLKATLLHNKIQNKLFSYLARTYSQDLVGTERNSGIGTLVDVVRKDGDDFTFYEIKTDKSLRICIRQAIPQLLEYSCWPDKIRAKELIIVSQHHMTDQAKKYIEHLRKTYNLPIFYQQFDLENERLGDMY